MASTGRMKNVDRNDEDNRKKRLAQLIRDNVRPKKSGGAFEMLELLARLDAKRLKLIPEIFIAMQPFALAQGDESTKLSEEEIKAKGVPIRVNLSELAKLAISREAAAREAEKEIKAAATPQRRRRRKRPNNVVAFKPPVAKETTGPGGEGPKAAS